MRCPSCQSDDTIRVSALYEQAVNSVALKGRIVGVGLGPGGLAAATGASTFTGSISAAVAQRLAPPAQKKPAPLVGHRHDREPCVRVLQHGERINGVCGVGDLPPSCRHMGGEQGEAAVSRPARRCNEWVAATLVLPPLRARGRSRRLRKLDRRQHAYQTRGRPRGLLTSCPRLIFDRCPC